MAEPKERLDRLLVEGGLAPNERVAQAMIIGHEVLVNDQVVTKPGTAVRRDARLRVRRQSRKYASRGGEKLDAALERFGVSVLGQSALDAGASTGGFTECLLAHGAARVFAVDAGYGQLHSRLMNDARVVVMERTNISDLRPESFGAVAPGFCSVDLSYLSLKKAVPILEAVIADDAPMVCLIKPLYEGLREHEYRDPLALSRVLTELFPALESVARRHVAACCPSPITGNNGSIEFLGLLRPEPARETHESLVERVITEAVQHHALT